MMLRLISIYCNHVRHWLGNAFLWPFVVPIHLKKQSRDGCCGRVQNGTCQASENMSMSKFMIIDAFSKMLINAAFLQLSLNSPSPCYVGGDP